MSQDSTVQAIQEAVAHHRAGRLAQAENVYRAVLASNPAHAEAIHFLGLIAFQSGRTQVAVELIERSLQLDPSCADAHSNLGSALRALGKDQEALTAFRRAVALAPHLSAPHHNVGVVLLESGRTEEALEPLRRALELKPDYVDALINLGNALRSLGRPDEALEHLSAAVRLDPVSIDTHNVMGLCFKEQGRLDDALKCFDRAIAIRPTEPVWHSNRIFIMLLHPRFDAAAIGAELRRWNLAHAEPLRIRAKPHLNRRDSSRRLRVGYVSPDFRNHVVGRNILPLIREHDRSQIEVFCYSDVLRPDPITARFQAMAHAWRPISGMHDDHVAELIRRDQIDLLIDCSVHTSGHRLTLFAQRPAPVQITFAGYPGSTGMSAMDYRLSDPFLDPPGQSSGECVEKTLWLPHSFWCYDPTAMELDSNDPIPPLPALTNGQVTFGCLNNFGKVTDEALLLWAKVMRAVDRSRLLLSAPQGSTRNRVIDRFGDEGVLPDRIDFAGTLPRPQYLLQFHRIDMALDTFPYNGHTTSLDCLWMGVPVVTLTGKTVVSRAGFSQLSNIGLPELSTRTPDEFIQCATDLASDLPRLANLRQTLRQRMLDSPLTNGAIFARGVESAYRQAWKSWCNPDTDLSQ